MMNIKIIKKKDRQLVLGVLVLLTLYFIGYLINRISMIFKNLNYRLILPVVLICGLIYFVFKSNNTVRDKKTEQKEYNIVKDHSLALKNLTKINEYYLPKIQTLKKEEIIQRTYSSKQSYDNADAYPIFYRAVSENLNYYRKILTKIYSNKDIKEEYLMAVKDNKNYLSTDDDIPDNKLLNKDRFKSIERKLYHDQSDHDFYDNISITIKMNYQSPKGYKSYSKKSYFGASELRKTIIMNRKDLETRRVPDFMVREERTKMSSKLRVKILNRDGYKCNYCGRSSKDGVKLHVDHIIPVSKGGKTEEKNLQTLCNDCNKGKSNMILD